MFSVPSTFKRSVIVSSKILCAPRTMVRVSEKVKEDFDHHKAQRQAGSVIDVRAKRRRESCDITAVFASEGVRIPIISTRHSQICW